MVKYRKFFVGTGLSVLAGFIGPIFWLINQNTVRMARDLKDLFTITLIVSFIPALLLYFLWYNQCVKAVGSSNKKMPSPIMYLVVGVILIVAVAVVPCVFMFQNGITHAIVTAVATSAGTVLAYFVGKPD